MNRVKQKIKEIEENLELIKDNLPNSAGEFKSLGLIKDGIYKRLEYSIQNLIDIFTMIYSSLNLGVPSSVDSILDELQENKIFSKKIIELVKEMKGLRNILAHRYGKIDDGAVFHLLKDKEDDFDKIIVKIEIFISSR
jgi:uncharacterized protein YutE (UPF0331/DUF86 family)